MVWRNPISDPHFSRNPSTTKVIRSYGPAKKKLIGGGPEQWVQVCLPPWTLRLVMVGLLSLNEDLAGRRHVPPGS
jgi:hypothetical protein